MNQQKITRMVSLMGGSLLAVIMLVWGMAQVGAAAPTAVDSPTALTRPQDPVIVPGAVLTAFDGVAIDELRLYVFADGSWQPIPFQIDEVVIVGSTPVYTTFEDGLLDANDELVFMGKDAGEAVPTSEWVMDTEARSNPRMVITATDSLQPGMMGYAYVYRSTTLATNPTAYVDWDYAAQTLTAVSYTLSFDPSSFVGVAGLTLNGNPTDVLDRQKTRVVVDPPVFPPVTFTEEDIPGLLGTPVTVSLPITGPVRAVGGGGVNSFAFYGSRSDTSVSLNLTEIPLPLPGTVFLEIRTSFDLLNPATTGMTPTTYYDSNTPAGVPVDGNPDAVQPTPLFDWYEISGSTGGFVIVSEATANVGTVQNYYLDDDTVDPDDTGDDGRSYGDTGAFIDMPDGVVSVAQSLYVTLPGAGSMGSTVLNWSENPLQAATAVQILSNEHDLTLTKVVDSATVAPGDTLTYTLTVLHSHPDTVTHGVVLSDIVPIGTTFITATVPFTWDGSTVEWFTPTLANGADWQVQMVVQVPLTPTVATVDNVTYAVRSEDVATVWGTLVSTPIVTPSNQHVLTLTKTAASATVASGDMLTYTLSVLHDHPDSPTYGVVLSDVVPIGTNLITATWPFTVTGSTVEWQTPTLASGAEWQVQLVVQVPPTTTMKSVDNVTYAVRSQEVETVYGTAVSTPILPNNWAIYLPFINKN